MAALLVSCVALAAGTGACGNPTLPPAPAAFDRPESVSFFCWDGDARSAVELGSCGPDPESENGSPTEPFELHAVVTQTTTGEVAAVQITGEDGDLPGVIDTDVRVPGFTFAAVGDVPAAVITPRRNPAFTYVISRGSGTFHVVRTNSFRTGLGATISEIRRSGEAFFPLASRPTAMALSPRENELVITLPEIGEVWFVPIDGDDIGAPVRVALGTVLPDPVDLSVPGVELPPTYEHVCAFDDGVSEVAPVPPRDPLVRDAAKPVPWGIAVDAEATGRVLIADRSLPIIHVIDLATHTELDPLSVSVPTREVVITPRVPARPGDTERTERFVYAIDDIDQSVLAVDYTDPARASFGAVLTVSAGPRRDRLDAPFPARAIEVASPAYSETAPLAYCASSEASSPRELHGVFLAVGTLDGRVRMFDVFDLDTPCRGIGCTGDITPDSDDLLVAIGRHRPRIGAFIGERISLDPAPSWEIAGATTSVDASGAARDLPPLGALPGGCPAGLGQVFPSSGDARVCVVTDPWASISQAFTASWEGALAFTTTTGGNFAGNAIQVRFDPCERGVLGRDDVPESGHLASYEGDVVAITGVVPPSVVDEALRMRCAELLQQNAAGDTTPILLPILEASFDTSRPTYSGRLVVGAPADGSLDDVRACFPELLQLEIRARGAFVVSSTRAGFRHPVVRRADGRCEVDSSRADALERGRALPGQVFRTPEVAFLVESAPPAGQRPVLRMSVADVPPALSYDISFDGQTDLVSLIADLQYNDVDDRLYVIDQARRGLIRMNLTEPNQPIEAVFR